MTNNTDEATIDLKRILDLPLFTERLSSLVSSINYRQFKADQTLDKRVILHDAIRFYLGTGDVDLVDQYIRQYFDTPEDVIELHRSVGELAGFSDLTKDVTRKFLEKHPKYIGHDILSSVGSLIADHVCERCITEDTSKPFDIAKGKKATVCFIPGSGKLVHYWDVSTRSWLPRSCSLSVYPDQTFIDFLKVIGVTKQEWLDAVNDSLDRDALNRMGPLLEERRKTWESVDEWEVIGSMDVAVQDVVDAVDACPYGFTPMIAFTMDAEEVFQLNFSEVLQVTGGIVGLHDFSNGTGDPIRFEGTLRLMPNVRDMHLCDDQPLGLIATHGFLDSSFTSVVRRLPLADEKVSSPIGPRDTPRP